MCRDPGEQDQPGQPGNRPWLLESQSLEGHPGPSNASVTPCHSLYVRLQSVCCSPPQPQPGPQPLRIIPSPAPSALTSGPR